MTTERTIGVFGATLVGIGGILGGGLMVLVGTAFNMAGPAAILAFALNGIVAWLTAMSVAEISSTFPQSGGRSLGISFALLGDRRGRALRRCRGGDPRRGRARRSVDPRPTPIAARAPDARYDQPRGRVRIAVRRDAAREAPAGIAQGIGDLANVIPWPRDAVASRRRS